MKLEEREARSWLSESLLKDAALLISFGEDPALLGTDPFEGMKRARDLAKALVKGHADQIGATLPRWLESDADSKDEDAEDPEVLEEM